jgi:serine/threonine-protein kinase
VVAKGGAGANPAGAAPAAPITAVPPRAAGKDSARDTLKENARDRKARESREREARAATVPPATGVVRIAVSPWGQVEVDGSPAGISPPLNELKLSEGRHQITLRNGDFPPYSATVDVKAGEPASLKYKFGS